MPNLDHLRARYREHPAVGTLLSALSADSTKIRLQVKGLTGAQASFVMAAVAQRLKSATPVLQVVIANAKEEAAYAFNDLEGVLGKDQTYFFPDSFKRPAFFDDLNQTQLLQRSEVISKVAAPEGPAIIVTYPEALFEKVVKPEVLQGSRIEVRKGERLDVDFMIQVLVEYGFERADFVYEPGQFSVRGGIVDLFSYGNELPYRIELYDDEVETLRTFDPTTQLSQQNLSQLVIVPNLNTRFQRDQKASLLEILPENTIMWVRDLQFLVDRLQYCFERAEQFASKVSTLESAELREIFRDRAFLVPAAVLEGLAEHPLIFMEDNLAQVKRNFPGLL